MVAKATRYSSQWPRLKTLFHVQRIKVVWGLKIWKQVETLVPALKGLEGGCALSAHHPTTYDLRHTARLTAMPLFFSPTDGKPHALMED